MSRVALDVPPENEGERLDRFLARHVAERTRSALRRLIDDGKVRVDGRPGAKAGMSLRAGMQVEVELPPPSADAPRGEPIPIRVVFEDEHLVVVDKPAGMVVHPAPRVRGGTLVNALLGRGLTLAAAGGEQRPGIVHRLDRDTSGLLVAARTDVAHRALCRAFAERLVSKSYLALVWGRPRPERGAIERPIGRSRAVPARMAVGGRGSRPALSHYSTLETMTGFALLEVRPVTGRTHQIRVHLKSIHHPIVGDTEYGGRAWRGVQNRRKRDAIRRFPRLALHAAELSFRHPVEDRELRLRAPLPAEFEALLAVLREER